MRRQHQAHGIILHMRSHRHIPDQPHELEQPLALENLLHGRLHPGCRPVQDFGELVARGVAHQNLEEEPVQLRFGQGIGPFLVNRVLRGHDKKGLVQPAQLSAGRDLVLLHGLQQGGLGLWRGAVDFVGQNQMGEDGPVLELELAAPARGFHHDVGAQDVGRHQVRRELDAVEG